MLIFGIESSCDETSCAVLSVEERDGGRQFVLKSNIIASQVETHKLFGGVVPEIASRAHAEVISRVAREALSEAGIGPRDIDAVAVTSYPGLIGCLLVGTSFAKGLASSLGVPVIPVNHIEAHAAAAYLIEDNLSAPFGALIVSGSHTSLYDVERETSFVLVGGSRDDAAGEAFDKVGRIIGLSYPAGHEMDELAARAKSDETTSNVPLPSPAIPGNNYDFSFSGLKTAALNYANTKRQSLRLKDGEQLPENEVISVAGAFTNAVCSGISKKLSLFLQSRNYDKLVMAGGVAANSHLREAASGVCRKHGVRLIVPPASLCGDNAAMVAAAGYFAFKAGLVADSSMNAYASEEAAKLGMERNGFKPLY